MHQGFQIHNYFKSVNYKWNKTFFRKQTWMVLKCGIDWCVFLFIYLHSHTHIISWGVFLNEGTWPWLSPYSPSAFQPLFSSPSSHDRLPHFPPNHRFGGWQGRPWSRCITCIGGELSLSSRRSRRNVSQITDGSRRRILRVRRHRPTGSVFPLFFFDSRGRQR